jgi:hypothetical protein
MVQFLASEISLAAAERDRPLLARRYVLTDGSARLCEVNMTKKPASTRRESAAAIARWEGEGGARKSPSEEERDLRQARVDADPRRPRHAVRRRPE